MRAVGSSLPRIDAAAKVTGVARFPGDIDIAGQAWAKVVFSGFAHGRITGWVLGFLPPVVAMVVFMISPTHMRLLIDDPMGLQMTMVGIALQIVGVLIIRKIVDVEY